MVLHVSRIREICCFLCRFPLSLCFPMFCNAFHNATVVKHDFADFYKKSKIYDLYCKYKCCGSTHGKLQCDIESPKFESRALPTGSGYVLKIPSKNIGNNSCFLTFHSHPGIRNVWCTLKNANKQK